MYNFYRLKVIAVICSLGVQSYCSSCCGASPGQRSSFPGSGSVSCCSWLSPSLGTTLTLGNYLVQVVAPDWWMSGCSGLAPHPMETTLQLMPAPALPIDGLRPLLWMHGGRTSPCAHSSFLPSLPPTLPPSQKACQGTANFPHIHLTSESISQGTQSETVSYLCFIENVRRNKLLQHTLVD